MNSDIISLRILLVVVDTTLASLLRESADQASLPMEVLEPAGAADAASLLAQENIDLVLVEAGLPALELGSIAKSARAAKNKPFVVAIGPSDSANIDCAMSRPANGDEARALVERCIRARVPARVLVVDDSATMRSIVRKTLAAGKFPVRVAECEEGLTALEELRRRQFELVFLDFNMPGLNGFETLHELRREHPNLAVVIMTATDNEAFADRARKSGAAFLKKPFYPADIDAVLYRLHQLDAPKRA